ncbi:streptophobe family protein [Streptomyces sp. NPDC018026]|uniref:streptophobe family protein n=1 Tax=Streptomyces sp. NPDC018026 TaxID=3365031 RepID=UPI0037AE8F02
MSASPALSSPPAWRHVLEGGLAVVAALATMAATAWAALTLLGADGVAPVSRLVPTLVSLAVGGGVTLESAAGSGSSAGGGGGGLAGLLGGGGEGGLSVSLTGQAALTPLTLTFLGTAVLATVFFRPLRRRARPAPAMLWARSAGALVTSAVALPVCAVLATGTARLPESVTDRMGDRAGSGGASGSGGLGGFGGFGGGGGGGLASGLASVSFRTDVVATAFLGVLGVAAVLALGCLAARRTALPRPLALSGLRTKWNAVLSTLAGTAAVLCCAVLAVAILAGAAALTGHGRTAEAAGVLLLAGPNLIAAVLTAGTGASWEAGARRVQPEGGGMLGMLGGGAGKQDGTADGDRSVDLGHWAGAGVPLWVIGLLLTLLLLSAAGYVAAARTPARTPRQDADSLLDRHADTALRMGIAVGVMTFVLPFLARGSLRVGVGLMGREMGGLDAGLDTSPRLSALTAFVVAALASYAGSRLHGRRARRRERPAGRARVPAPRRRAVTSDSAS